MQRPHSCNALPADVAPRATTDGRAWPRGPKSPEPQSAAQILWREHGRRPLRCDEGPVRSDLHLAQLYAAQCRGRTGGHVVVQAAPVVGHGEAEAPSPALG